MIRCIAIDDEELALELLEDNIRQVPFLELVATCSNPLAAMKIMEQETVDLVFLDIQMPGLTGLQFIRSSAAQCMYILITAYEKYALEGFNLNVVDYLVKPVALDRFIQACMKAKDLYQLRQQSVVPKETAADYFFINIDYSLVKLMYSDIVWIEGLKDYVKIHLKNNAKPMVARMSMKALEEQLPRVDVPAHSQILYCFQELHYLGPQEQCVHRQPGITGRRKLQTGSRFLYTQTFRLRIHWQSFNNPGFHLFLSQEFTGSSHLDPRPTWQQLVLCLHESTTFCYETIICPGGPHHP